MMSISNPFVGHVVELSSVLVIVVAICLAAADVVESDLVFDRIKIANHSGDIDGNRSFKALVVDLDQDGRLDILTSSSGKCTRQTSAGSPLADSGIAVPPAPWNDRWEQIRIGTPSQQMQRTLQ